MYQMSHWPVAFRAGSQKWAGSPVHNCTAAWPPSPPTTPLHYIVPQGLTSVSHHKYLKASFVFVELSEQNILGIVLKRIVLGNFILSYSLVPVCPLTDWKWVGLFHQNSKGVTPEVDTRAWGPRQELSRASVVIDLIPPAPYFTPTWWLCRHSGKVTETISFYLVNSSGVFPGHLLAMESAAQEFPCHVLAEWSSGGARTVERSPGETLRIQYYFQTIFKLMEAFRHLGRGHGHH